MSKNFWGMMNKRISVNNNYQSTRKSSSQERRAEEVNSHQFKNSIGGDSGNYKGENNVSK